MTRNYLSLNIRVLLILSAIISVSHPALAAPWWFPFWPDHPHKMHPNAITPVAADEFDLRLAIEGLAMAGAACALIWERMRRRR